MAQDLSRKEFWLEANGKVVEVQGKKYKIKVSSWQAIYPYKRYVISVDAEMVNKNDPEYIEIRQKLGDDWSTNVLESGEDFYAAVYLQLFPGRT